MLRIAPADAPRRAELRGHGRRIEIVSTASEPSLATDTVDPAICAGPSASDDSWHRGRAGMEYRDLIPGRLGGTMIASHIRIPTGGEVSDYVHWHDVAFQFIYVLKGRVRLVYEDFGEPFWMEKGDCVLQPPEIRHRVLECSDGLEVLEVGAPADHATFGDPGLHLPNGVNANRVFGRDQRFWLHRAEDGNDFGLLGPTGGVVDARVVTGRVEVDEGRMLFGFVLEGVVEVEIGEEEGCVIGVGGAFAREGSGSGRWGLGVCCGE